MIGPIILQIVLIILNAIFASAEIAVISMNENKLKKMAADGDSRAIKLTSLTSQPARFLATIQVAITLAGLLGSAFAAENFAGPLVTLLVNAGVTIPEHILKSASVFLITLVLAYFNLVFGELVPKRLAMKKAETMALGMSGMLHLVSKAFAPLVLLLTVSTNVLLRLMGIDPNEDDDKVTEEEIRMLLTAGNEQGTIPAVENEIIQNVFEFNDTSVEQICTHRIDVISLDISDDIDVWENIIHSRRHTYYPICGESTDDIIGILDTKDYFRTKSKSKDIIVEEAVDKAYFIPETMKANTLFQNMKQRKIYFAVIIDEYGGLSGIITLHDLIETLVGELDDIEDPPRPKKIEKLGDNGWCIYGHADLDTVSQELDLDLPVDMYDTYNGFICGIIGRVPNDGESFECEYQQLKIKVHTVENHMIGNTTVQQIPNLFKDCRLLDSYSSMQH